jgi:mRNA-degrading endonuclease RelE of RelBE toxin-antitoxin system
LRVELTPELKKALRALPQPQRKRIGDVITAVRDGFGAPHHHSGLGIRRLRGSLFECRAGLKLRLTFDAEPGLLSFSDLGTHDEIRKIIKHR